MAAEDREWTVSPGIRRCCNPGTALTLGQLRRAWQGLPDDSRVLVSRSPFEADWAQGADAIRAGDGLTVLRLLAPWARQAQPAPGTVYAPATPVGEVH